MVSWQTAGDALHKKSNSVKSAQICSNPQFPEDLVTFTEEILNGKLHFLCSVMSFVTKAKILLTFLNQKLISIMLCSQVCPMFLSLL